MAKELVLMKGNQAIAEAAIRCGCDGYFGYPITPQSEVLEHLMAERPYLTTGMVVLQAESELASINMVYAGAAAGKRVMTSSSSPGFSLMQEGLSYIAGAELPALCVTGALMLGSSLTLYQAYRYMDTGIASTLLFIYPVVVATVMTLFFYERLNWRTVAGIVLALAGVAALSRSDGGAVFSWKGLLLSLASALSYSLFIVSVRVSVLRDSPADKIAFYAMILSAAVCLLLSLAHNRLPLPRTATAVGCVLMLALLPTVTALVLTALAIHRIGATPASIFGALEPVVAVLCGIIVFHEKFTWNIAVGVLLIFCSMLAAVLKPSQ